MRRCAGCGCLQARRGEGTVVRQWRRRCRGGAAGTAYVAVACHCHRECSWFYYLHGVTLELRLAQLTRREPVQGCAPLLLTASCPSWHWTRLPRCTPPPLPSACWACAGCQQPWPARSEALPSPRPAPCQGGPQGQPPGPRRGSCWSTGGAAATGQLEAAHTGRQGHRQAGSIDCHALPSPVQPHLWVLPQVEPRGFGATQVSVLQSGPQQVRCLPCPTRPVSACQLAPRLPFSHSCTCCTAPAASPMPAGVGPCCWMP